MLPLFVCGCSGGIPMHAADSKYCCPVAAIVEHGIVSARGTMRHDQRVRDLLNDLRFLKFVGTELRGPYTIITPEQV
jgi:hypothetical protein